MSVLIVIVVVGTRRWVARSTAGSAAARLELPLDVVGWQVKGPRPLSTHVHGRTAGKERS